MQTSIARSPFPSFATYHLTCDSARDPAGQVGFARPVRPDSAHACKSSLSSRHGAPITPEWFECHTRPRAGASQTNAFGYLVRSALGRSEERRVGKEGRVGW